MFYITWHILLDFQHQPCPLRPHPSWGGGGKVKIKMASCIFPHRQRQRGHSDPLHFVSHLQAALCISIKKEWWDRNSPIIKGGSTNKSECCVPISAQFPSCCSPTTKLPPNRERETRAAGKSVLEDAIGREMCQNSFTLVPVLWDSSHNKERNQSFYFFLLSTFAATP